jgi:hypothetical protein
VWCRKAVRILETAHKFKAREGKKEEEGKGKSINRQKRWKQDRGEDTDRRKRD